MASTITLKAAGLNTSPNQLELTEGSLIEAKNVIIRRDNIIEPIRGYKVYGTSMGNISDRAKTLFEYRERIFRHYGETLEFQNGLTNAGDVNFTEFNEAVVETQTDLRIKKTQSNGNLYFTTQDGIKKISAVNGDGLFSAEITNAGGVKAVDFTATLNVTDGDQSSFLPQDSAVAYRHLWAIKDINSNLIPGTPSQREEVYNSLNTLLLRDFSRVLRGLDGVSTSAITSLINDGTYVDSLLLPMTATAIELQANLIALASKIDKDILVAENTVTTAPLDISTSSITSGVCTINFSVGNPTAYWSVGSKIYLTAFTPASGTLDGLQSVTAITSTSISFNTTASGAVTVGAGAKIESGTYRNITEPAVPAVPTSNQELVALQTYLDTIIIALQASPTTGTPPTINSTAKTTWIDTLDLTTTANVIINITIPEGVTTNHFYQLYRSSISQATDAAALDDLVPSDELQLVYEGYPTSSELSAGEVVFTDVTPDEFRGANLYTNPATGEGILQANDIPPFAKDINRFKNVVFYANTRTRHRLQLNLLGVQTMLADINLGTTPKISILSEDSAQTYTFVKGVKETTTVTTTSGATLAASGTASYFLLYSANDAKEYYVWYKVGTSTDPAISGKTGIQVQATALTSASDIATLTERAISSYPWDFSANCVGPIITVTNQDFGPSTDATQGTTTFTVTVTQQGVGENAALNQILLSDRDSVAISVDETARSIVRVINKNNDEVIYAYYLSSSNDVPGKISFESKDLEDQPFYFVGNNAVTGAAFNPDISGDFSISSITTGSSPTITTASPHGLVNGAYVVLAQTNSTPSVDGVYPIYQATTSTFKIDLSAPITVAATSGQGIANYNAAYSDNETKVNRVYYSKLSQPESVPILNYFDVGDSDKQILRIFPLRDSLFVFKEEGLYRISGETAPFTLALFDSSCQLTGPDTVDVNNNLIYLLTTQGVMTVSEGGVNIISRPIDETILRLPVFPQYKSLSFGVGYESDNSYTLWTVKNPSDDCATIGYRYSNLTSTWTTVDRELTCGFINPVDDKLYHGAGDINFLEQERKAFDRFDYAGREYDLELLANNYFGTQIRLNDVSNVVVGDVIVQTQFLTCYEFNMLLKKLDIDPTVADSDYYTTLVATSGDNLRVKLESLAAKLDADTGITDTDYAAKIASITKTVSSISTASPTVITTSTPHGLFTGRNIILSSTNSSPSVNGTWPITVTGASTFTILESVLSSGSTGTAITDINSFQDIKACYNIIINKLNLDSGVAFTNYDLCTTETEQEVIILAVNYVQKKVTVNSTVEFIVGPLVLFKAIDTAFTYGPNLFGNSVSFKHFSDATMMFENKAFSTAKMEFATDLLPEFQPQLFSGDGNGAFGFTSFGEGFFGGSSHSAPFRTYVPRQCQRARYLVVRFNHAVARESYKIFGMTLTGNDTGSTRAYR